jgi:hypothetical protein
MKAVGQRIGAEFSRSGWVRPVSASATGVISYSLYSIDNSARRPSRVVLTLRFCAGSQKPLTLVYSCTTSVFLVQKKDS